MRTNDKIKTSVFSEYENNENDSISSKQLEYWLKQTAPVIQPKFAGLEWTLMSTNSIFEQEEHTLQRNETFESLNKENDQLAYNSAKPMSNNSSAVMKSKSYVNAMVDLQNKVKHLEIENNSLKKSVCSLKEARNQAMSESTHVAEELKSRLEMLEPKTRRLDEVVRDNKMLRDMKEQNVRKIKLLEKINKQNQMKLIEYEKQAQIMRQNINSKDTDSLELSRRLEQDRRCLQKTKQALLKLQERNKILEDMKERSTTSIIEKYNKSAEMVESLTAENMRLKDELERIKYEALQKGKTSEENNRKDNEQYKGIIDRLKQELIQKKELIKSLQKQGDYFKEKYQLSNQELKTILKQSAQEILQLKKVHEQEVRKIREQPREKQIVYIERMVEDRKEEIDLNKESEIKLSEERKQIESQLQFEDFNEEIQPTEELHETRSLEKEVPKFSITKSIKHKPSDCLSQQQRKTTQPLNQKSSAKRKNHHVATKSRKDSNEKNYCGSVERNKVKSKQKELEQDKSFVLKSCEPVTQHHYVEPHMYEREPFYYNSASQQRQKVPYYWEPNEVAEFTHSQRATVNNDKHSLQWELLAQAQREAIRLFEQQERIMSMMTEYMDSSERLQCQGRMKQINSQITSNSERIHELKMKIASN